MPKGPKGEKRPADVIGAAVMVGKIATGEIDDLTTDDGKNAARWGAWAAKRGPEAFQLVNERRSLRRRQLLGGKIGLSGP